MEKRHRSFFAPATVSAIISSYHVMQLPKRVVFIADRQFDHSAPTLERVDLEFAEHDYDEILAALRRICDDVVCYSSPAELAGRAIDHLNDVVLSIWSGVR